MDRPTIAVSMGDPAGIGPELVVSVLGDPTVYEGCRPVVIGDEQVIRAACRLLDTRPEVRPIAAAGDARGTPTTIDVLRPAGLDVTNIRPGEVSPAAGAAAALCLTTAFDLANIARKLLATWSGATIFLGLPVICATTAHGTAFDIVGRGVADPGSLRAALDYAVALARPA